MRKQHQQEYRTQRPTERSNPTQQVKGRTGDCPGPRKETTPRRNVTQGGGGGGLLFSIHEPLEPRRESLLQILLPLCRGVQPCTVQYEVAQPRHREAKRPHQTCPPTPFSRSRRTRHLPLVLRSAVRRKHPTDRLDDDVSAVRSRGRWARRIPRGTLRKRPNPVDQRRCHRRPSRAGAGALPVGLDDPSGAVLLRRLLRHGPGDRWGGAAASDVHRSRIGGREGGGSREKRREGGRKGWWWGGWHKATVSDCLPLAAPVGLSPLLILTLYGSERVLVVSTEPLDDLSCFGGGGGWRRGGGGGGGGGRLLTTRHHWRGGRGQGVA